jgi:ankyrin repeat protein
MRKKTNEDLLHPGVYVDEIDINSCTALECATENGCTEIVKSLLDAVYEGDLQRVKSVLDQGADVNAKDIDGWTALMYASLNGYADIVKYLIDHGADINVKNKYGETALLLASKHDYQDIVALLESHGAKK